MAKWIVYRAVYTLPSRKPWWAFGPKSAQFATWRQAFDYADKQARKEGGEQ